MFSDLRCPATGQRLAEVGLGEAERECGPLLPCDGRAFGKTDRVLLREDHAGAYPVADGVPILMTPEFLAPTPVEVDLNDPRWAEAYAEMEFYNAASQTFGEGMDAVVAEVRPLVGQRGYSREWLDASYDAQAQLEALEHLGDPDGRRVLQLGGSGSHAVRALAAGAGEVWLLTPMLNEALYAAEWARRLSVGERFAAVVGIAEELPFIDGMFDSVYSGGCLHHMVTEYAGPEIRRVLVDGGRFAAIEPWATPLHKYGTGLIGKREPNAYCRPLNEERLAPLRHTFPGLDVRRHGPLLRYLALAWLKASKRPMRPATGLRLSRVDDTILPAARLGGSVAVLATKVPGSSQ
jgi:SAM-dependent methyltransferase/uncharacterized protein YbaR (Trm112 family)